jgi:hypothetical protein
MTVQEAIQEALKMQRETSDIPMQKAFKTAFMRPGTKDDIILALSCATAALGFQAGQIFEQNKKRMVEG